MIVYSFASVKNNTDKITPFDIRFANLLAPNTGFWYRIGHAQQDFPNAAKARGDPDSVRLQGASGQDRRHLAHVCEMLTKTTTPIDLIGGFCGFASNSNLKSAFRARYGMSLSDYRANHA